MYEFSFLQEFHTGARALTALTVNVSQGLIALGSYYTSTVLSVDLASGNPVQEYNCGSDTVLALWFENSDLYCISRNYPSLSAYLVNMTKEKRTRLLSEKNFDAAACVYPYRVALSWAREILVVDLADSKVIAELRGHSDSIESLAMSSNGRLLASASADSTVRVWDIDALKCLQVLRLRTPKSVAFGFGGDLLAIGCSAGQVDFWHLDTDRHFYISTEADSVVGAVHFPCQERVFYTATWDGRLSMWNVQPRAK